MHFYPSLITSFTKIANFDKTIAETVAHTYSNILGINSKNMQTKFTETTVLLPKL
jgi:hypothetical protein